MYRVGIYQIRGEARVLPDSLEKSGDRGSEVRVLMHLKVETMVNVGRNGEPISHCIPDSDFVISRSLRHRIRMVVLFSFESSAMAI